VGVKLWEQAVKKAETEIRQAMLNERLEAPSGNTRIDPDTQHCYKTSRVGWIKSDGISIHTNCGRLEGISSRPLYGMGEPVVGTVIARGPQIPPRCAPTLRAPAPRSVVRPKSSHQLVARETNHQTTLASLQGQTISTTDRAAMHRDFYTLRDAMERKERFIAAYRSSTAKRVVASPMNWNPSRRQTASMGQLVALT